MQLPPAGNVEILSRQLTESEKQEIWRHTWITGHFFNRLISVAPEIGSYS